MANRDMTITIQNQIESSLVMLQRLIDVIPAPLWIEQYHGIPIWHQVYHVVFFVDSWFREYYVRGQKDHLVRTFDERISPELNQPPPEGVLISQEEMRLYLKEIYIKVCVVFDKMTDEKLALPIIENGRRDYSHLDILVGQVRHIMYNIGYFNCMLRERGSPEADWYSYNEGDRVAFITD